MSNTLPTMTEGGWPWEPTPNRKRFTRKECEFLEQNELLMERYELIDGEIIFKVTQNPPHRFVIVLVAEWLRLIFGGLFVVAQSPIEVAVSESEINVPEPDVMVQTQPITAFATRLPGPADIVLVVEVSDSTLRFDLRNKAALYARAGIVEYWVADVSGRRFIVHREPTPDGYAQVAEYAEDAAISTLSRPDATIRVSALLPPVKAA